MRLVQFLEARGISQAAIERTMERLDMRLYQPDISRMIRGKKALGPKARLSFRLALVELQCDPKAVAKIVDLKDPPSEAHG